ncbi:MAG: DUF1570 domain-containing protein [Phycisphaerales bacterium]|nr:DUF1570 domain-containing protein [Phycisphaerales bacterium]
MVSALLLALSTGACAGSRASDPSGPIAMSDLGSKARQRGPVAGGSSSSPSAANAPGVGVVRSVSHWSFEGTAGQTISTDHFIIRTTDSSPAIAERLPGMMEAALANYTSVIADLPAPKRVMEMFVLSQRSQWQRLTLRELGERGRGVISIGRGGFAFGGRAYLFDIGSADTMSIASHEGWHQYVQTTFVESLPVWADEGIATFMEGHRWVSTQGQMSVGFSGWSNMERFERLRSASNTGDADDLLTLEVLLGASPDQILAMGNDKGVTYYAQIWALIHFLREGEGGRYRAGFERMVKDAATGRLGATVINRLRASGQLEGTSRNGVFVLARSLGVQIFRTYIDPDINRLNGEYQRFVQQVVAPGSAQRISQGQSPIR